MAQNSSIEWTGRTWQVTAGCSRASPGCQNCYAERMAGRLAAMAKKDIGDGRDPGKKGVYLKVVNGGAVLGPKSGWNRNVVILPENLGEPQTWRKPQMVFVDSMSDLFHEQVPFDFIHEVMGVIAARSYHTFQVLTKRTDRMAQYFEQFTLADVYAHCLSLERSERAGSESPHYYLRALLRHNDAVELGETDIPAPFMPKQWPLPNVWLGTSVENQEWAEKRIPHLLKCPAAVRFLSCEPLLGPIDFNALGDGPWNYNALSGLRENPYGDVVDREYGAHVDWVIVGGESGGGARPMTLGWAKDIVRQCKAAKVKVFVKQVGAKPVNREGQRCTKVKDSKGGVMSEWPAELRIRQMPVGGTRVA